MLENIRLSIKGIWSHKMRSLLTMLGIIIGIAAIISIVSTIQGTNEQIKQNLIGAGDNSLTVQLYQDDWTYEMEYMGIPEGIPVITQSVMEQIRGLEGVEDASVFTVRNAGESVSYGKTTLSGGSVCGIEESYFSVSGLQICRGRGLSGSDFSQFRNVAVLDVDSENALFQGKSGIGKTIEIKGVPFVIVGVVQKRNGFEPVINSMEDYYLYAQDSSGKIYIPNTSWPVVFAYDEPQSVLVKAETTDSMTRAGQQTAEILNGQIQGEDSPVTYKSQNLLEQAKEIQELGNATNRMLIWIAGISLLVGGIGVMNIMLVSVTERTQEIGLKKAIGATRKHIMMQFLTESVVLTSLGGVLGIVAGIILAQIISKISGTPVLISTPAALAAFGFSMAIGIIFGILPSYKAANLNPIEALRRE